MEKILDTVDVENVADIDLTSNGTDLVETTTSYEPVVDGSGKSILVPCLISFGAGIAAKVVWDLISERRKAKKAMKAAEAEHQEEPVATTEE